MIDGIASSNLDSGTNPLTHTYMNIIMKITMKDGISYLVNVVDDITFHKNGTIIDFTDTMLGDRTVLAAEVRRIAVVQL